MARQARHRGRNPHWDQQLHELWWGNVLVKRFREPAHEQELILRSFEELGWPARMDDPLPPRADINEKLRLRDTIKRLNRGQIHRLIRFRGDGTGKGIRWEKCQSGHRAATARP